ncbi:MAG: hypothetical protein ABL982_15015, partial [Vicinamibacterales bacterium]
GVRPRVESAGMKTFLQAHASHPEPDKALAVAGGLKDFADTKNIRILRKGPTGQSTLPFNYRDAIRGAGSSAVLLQPGDTVVVPD